MAKSTAPSPGSDLADRLTAGLREAATAPRAGARELPVIRGAGKGGQEKIEVVVFMQPKAKQVAVDPASFQPFNRGDKLTFSATPGQSSIG